MVQATTATTTFQNTPETDLMPEVYHTVSWSSEKTSGVAYVKAKDPMHAIRIINNKSETEMIDYAVKPASN